MTDKQRPERVELTDEERAELRRLAEEWEEDIDPSRSAKGMENAQHIASANPSTVLRLLDENAALRAERDQLSRLLETECSLSMNTTRAMIKAQAEAQATEQRVVAAVVKLMSIYLLPNDNLITAVNNGAWRVYEKEGE